MSFQRRQWALSAVWRLVVRLSVPLWLHLKEHYCACLAIHTIWHCPVTPHQNKTADHPQHIKKEEEVVRRWPLISKFLILVTSLLGLPGPPLLSLLIRAFLFQPVKCTNSYVMVCRHKCCPWVPSCSLLTCLSSYQVNRCGQPEWELIKPYICLHNQTWVSYLVLYLSLPTDTLILPFCPFLHPCQPTTRYNQP